MNSSQIIYLCYSYNTVPKCFYICKRFASEELARSQQEGLVTLKSSKQNQPKPSSVIIPVCKYIPYFLHSYVLRYKLSKHFHSINIY